MSLLYGYHIKDSTYLDYVPIFEWASAFPECIMPQHPHPKTTIHPNM